MGKLAGIRITNIDWCVEDEDVIQDLYGDDEDFEANEENVRNVIDSIKRDLPTEEWMPTNKQRLANDLALVADWLSDKYGWLVNSFNYNIVDENGNVLV